MKLAPAGFLEEVNTMKSTLARFLATTALLALGGCATSYTVDNRVQSFSELAAAAPAVTYRFERLPSQQQRPRQAELEAMADAALLQAGLRRDDTNARYTVQVAAHVHAELSPWADPFWGRPGWRWGFGYTHGWRHARVGVWGPPEPPWYRREVSVVVRELASNKVVYESHAVNDGPWATSPKVLSAMFQAAMQGFPAPPAGPRQVNITVPAG